MVNANLRGAVYAIAAMGLYCLYDVMIKFFGLDCSPLQLEALFRYSQINWAPALSGLRFGEGKTLPMLQGIGIIAAGLYLMIYTPKPANADQ